MSLPGYCTDHRTCLSSTSSPNFSTYKINKNPEESEDQEEDNLIYLAVDKVTVKDLESKERMLVSVNETQVALYFHRGKVYAMQEKCPHNGGPLNEGDIEDLPSGPCIRCPWHSWKFNLETGMCMFPKAKDRKAIVYPTKTKEQQILIGFDKIAPAIFSTLPP